MGQSNVDSIPRPVFVRMVNFQPSNFSSPESRFICFCRIVHCSSPVAALSLRSSLKARSLAEAALLLCLLSEAALASFVGGGGTRCQGGGARFVRCRELFL